LGKVSRSMNTSRNGKEERKKRNPEGKARKRKVSIREDGQPWALGVVYPRKFLRIDERVPCGYDVGGIPSHLRRADNNQEEKESGRQ